MTVLDIGGQDSKAIAMNRAGKVAKFEMNDRCAAGTGKFLEIMARSLGFSLEQFASEALKAEKDIQINSMCTVFAESEVTSLVARGEDRRNIALGLHKSVVRRAAGFHRRAGGLLRRSGQEPLHAAVDGRYLAAGNFVCRRPADDRCFGSSAVGCRHITLTHEKTEMNRPVEGEIKKFEMPNARVCCVAPRESEIQSSPDEEALEVSDDHEQRQMSLSDRQIRISSAGWLSRGNETDHWPIKCDGEKAFHNDADVLKGTNHEGT